MFLCDKCAKEMGIDSFWRTISPRSAGPCEGCNNYNVCIDVNPPKPPQVISSANTDQPVAIPTTEREQDTYMDQLMKSRGRTPEYTYTGPVCHKECKNYSHYETKHHSECPRYKGSLSEKHDTELQQLREENERLMKEIGYIKRNAEKINENTWKVYKEEILGHVEDAQNVIPPTHSSPDARRVDVQPKDDPIINHMRNVKLLQAIHGESKFYVECSPTDSGAIKFPNSNRAIKEIELPNFPIYEEKFGYKWVKDPQPVAGEQEDVWDELSRYLFNKTGVHNIRGIVDDFKQKFTKKNQ